MTLIHSSNIRLHDTTHSPLGLWQLQGGLTDESGNGYTLTVEAGTEQYVPIGNGVQGHFFDGSTNLIYNTAEAALRLLGDVTIELLVSWVIDEPGQGVNSTATGPGLVSHGTSGETAPTNVLYGVFANPGGGYRWLQETGGGTNQLLDQDGTFPAHVLHHLAMVRDSGVVTMYWNGIPFATSGSLTAPTDGSSGRFVLGTVTQGSTEYATCVMASVKLIGSALTTSQVQAEYERTLG